MCAKRKYDNTQTLALKQYQFKLVRVCVLVFVALVPFDHETPVFRIWGEITPSTSYRPYRSWGESEGKCVKYGERNQQCEKYSLKNKYY